MLPAAKGTPVKEATSPRRSYMVTLPGTVVTFEMKPVPGGTLTVATPQGGKRKVQVAPFWIGATEVTWDAYDVFAYGLDRPEEERAEGVDAISRPSRPYGAPDRGFGHAGYPAIGITFFAAAQYCRWLTVRTGRTFRLPTEVEWEYACRSGAVAREPVPSRLLDRYAWTRENAGNRTHPVGKKAPNAWGIYDMLGNVAEWCRGTDGRAVVRGGSYLDRAVHVNCRTRAFQTPTWNASDPQNPKSRWWLTDAPFVGFRVVCEQAAKEDPR